MHAKLLIDCWPGSAKTGVRHDKSSDRSAAKKTDDGFQGQECPY